MEYPNFIDKIMKQINEMGFTSFLGQAISDKRRKNLSILKRGKPGKPKSIIVYYEDSSGIFKLVEFLYLYTECNLKIRKILDSFLED